MRRLRSGGAPENVAPDGENGARLRTGELGKWASHLLGQSWDIGAFRGRNVYLTA